MKSKFILAVALALATSATAAFADWKPEKPITIIVPYPPGGVTDLAVRAVAADLEPALEQKLVVVNQPGANGSVGTQAVMDAPKDGYTWLSGGVRDIGTYKVMGMLDTTFADWNPFIIASMSSLLSVNPDVGITTVEEFIERVKAEGDKFLIATAGPNSSGGQGLAAIAVAAGIKPNQIVYDGGNPAILATVSGEAQATTQLALEQAEMIRAGRLKPLAAIGTTEIKLGDLAIQPITAQLPNLPPAENFVGIYLPAGVPQEVIDKLESVWTKTLSDSQGLNQLCTSRGCGVKPVSGAEAKAAANPAIAAAAWGLYDRGDAKMSPDDLGIKRP
ncbi:MAG: tripartite tricarboxylate transporter substrate binding protein [Rhizobiaceae bacterium]|nr:tripartite tricarboxylate transporter substrate binding protein [Rhizobiaceae bacterium]